MIQKGGFMNSNKVIVLTKGGEWLELETCIVIGAVEHPDKAVYHKFMFCKCEEETKREMLKRAEQFIAEQSAEGTGENG
jgi:hypothetical protein